MAPATDASSRSLTEHESTLPTALISASGSGSDHATRLALHARPLKRVRLSSGISASLPTSWAIAPATLA
ncbi:MAG: hypothetical protein AW07_02716 [Candidatus Accumulibacter sp. SK-11]|nr:MAG: hypothetical protein AW07_02716 [Candidatus Accumulibacter sp. SK-11]